MRLALLLALVVGCGSVSRVDVDAGELLEAGRDLLEARDAVAECPPTMLSCSGERGGCAQGQIVAKRSECGGAPFPVCCPANDCELAACEPCAGCP